MRLRTVLARVLLLGVAVGSGSCLVVSDPDFRGQEDCLPFFVTQLAEPALTSAQLIPPDGDAGTGGTGAIEFRGSAPMRSCALVKTYQMRVFLDNQLQSDTKIPPTGDEERPVSVLVDLRATKPGCHQVEVLVSTEFATGFTDLKAPQRPSDLAYLVWWFRLRNADAKLEDCPQAAP